MNTIYLDHNATTPIRPEVVDGMNRCFAEYHANPASQHRAGQEACRALEDAREKVAALLDADLAPPRRDRVLFTSGGTEANNMAVLGIARAQASDRGHVVVSAGEHPSVLEPAEHLLECGWRLDTLGLTPEGVVRVEQLPAILAARPHGASVLLASHETGVVQPIGELAALCSEAGVPLHVDAVQAVGKIPVSFRELGVAAMSVAAHKFGGPIGVGALVVRQDVPIAPLMFGGHQQWSLRPGTESVALAVGMATALELRHAELADFSRRMTALRDRFEQSLRAELPEVVVHGVRAARLPQTSNVGFPGLDGEVFRMALDLAGVACSVGAACSSGSTELSPTLRAMGLPGDLAASSLRFSLGATTTEAEIDEAVRRIACVCRELRG